MRIIDLSQTIRKNPGEPHDFCLEQISHKAGAKKFSRQFVEEICIDEKKIFPDDEFLNLDVVTASTHTGTHIDAPFHYGSKSEGKAAGTIDEMPIDWFFGNGVVLDMTHRSPGEYITAYDILQAEEKIKYQIDSRDIVLIYTGASAYWGKKAYFTQYPGLSRDAVKELTDRGVHVIGTDAYGLDRPFPNMIEDYKKTGNNEKLFPVHFFGREKAYCQIERLTNLNLLVPCTGFKIACFPIKIMGAGAAWTRAVAIY